MMSVRAIESVAANSVSPSPRDIKIGKDILELLSSSMYVDPMSIYREYVQNAADSIDEAAAAGFLGKSKRGEVEISIDALQRTIRIRDNGAGIAAEEMASRLLAFGGSNKRGTSARGFRGVGRLAGLGYCQELVFRSRRANDEHVTELRWDGRRLKEALRSIEYDGSLNDLVSSTVKMAKFEPGEFPKRFFEVELKGVIRHRNDTLLNADAVERYLSEVAPVPFRDDFAFSHEINAALANVVSVGHLSIRINDNPHSVTRPHREVIDTNMKTIGFESLQIVKIPDIDGNIGAIAWLAHHGYTGAISNQAGFKGLRFRCGNLQVGNHALVEDLFPEPRFNVWAVGEVHVLDPRIMPNGRRDHFEASIHFDNLRNHLGPLAREISKRCRSSSIQRNALRQFELLEEDLKVRFSILKQGSISKNRRRTTCSAIRDSLLAMEKIWGREIIPEVRRIELRQSISAAKKKFEKLTKTLSSDPLAGLPTAKRNMYAHLFELVYECSANQAAAKLLVERILTKIN